MFEGKSCSHGRSFTRCIICTLTRERPAYGSLMLCSFLNNDISLFKTYQQDERRSYSHSYGHSFKEMVLGLNAC